MVLRSDIASGESLVCETRDVLDGGLSNFGAAGKFFALHTVASSCVEFE